MPQISKLKALIENLAYDEGFVAVGYLNSSQARFPGWIDDWLENNYQGDMDWMKNHKKIRSNPCQIIENGKSIISLIYPYHTIPPVKWSQRHLISNYAWGKDYHVELKKKLKRVLKGIRIDFPNFEGRYFTDSAPIPEKIVASACGLGWIGKNSLLINKKFGSYVFIAEMVCNQDFLSTQATKEYCGSCRKCLEACPSQAILPNKVIDSNRCISYLTIEKKGDFSEKEKKLLKHQLFGCDICQQVCPWNKKIAPQPDPIFQCDEKWRGITPEQILETSEKEFDIYKINSPLKRTGLENLKRNARALMQNQSGLID